MKRQYNNKVGFEFTIHFYYRYEISQSDRTQTIETVGLSRIGFSEIKFELLDRPIEKNLIVSNSASILVLIFRN